MKTVNTYLLMTTVLALTLGSQAVSSYTISADSVYKHVVILASDSLEGRETGEIGEMKAARYISTVFTSAGLAPMGDTGAWLQAFEFVKKIELGDKNRLVVGGVELKLHEEFRPLPHSGSLEFQFDEIVSIGYGIISEDSSQNDYEGKDVEGKAVLIKRYSPATDDSTQVELEKYSSLTDKVFQALDHKAAGVFFYTPEGHDDTMITARGAHVTPKDIPIIWVRRAGIERLGLDLSDLELKDAVGETQLIPQRDTGYNVVGYLPSSNDTVMILGAHYDHLGWGGSGSRYLGKEKKIHYGADDNGSGVAALLELARTYSAKRDSLKYSYIFIAFSGEEKGLLGSGHFVRNLPTDTSMVRMAVNMDMIGRLKDQEKGLAIFGTGTCIEFKDFFDSLKVENIKISLKEGGIGPSDHTSFYNNNIPVLFFFTGAHEDYHTPEDVIEKIDSDGIVQVASLVDNIVTHFDRYDGPLTFQRTKDEKAGHRRSSFSVTLGIMPDFITEVQGMGVDGVSEGRPADRAGILKGDVIIKMGRIVVDDIYAYMNALGKFRKGDTATVVVERGGDTLSLLVEFN